MTRTSIFAWAVAASLTASLALAAVPQTINYQGYLTDTGGTPLNVPVNMTFSLYTSLTDTLTPPLWTETQNGVSVANGRYSVILGSVTPLAIAFDAQYYLGVAVGGDPEMTPRQMLTSTPYALRAGQADGLSSTATITTTNQIISTVPTGTAPFQVTSTTMVPNLNAEMVGGKRAADFVLKAGDTMTGTLTVPSLVSSGSATINGNIVLSTTTATGGIIRQNTGTLMHSYGYRNFFAGLFSGNLTMSGGYNTGGGYAALSGITTGQGNTAFGNYALNANSTGYENTAVGWDALHANTSGWYNTAVGSMALYANTTGAFNTATGQNALQLNTTGNYNTASGNGALAYNSSGFRNTASGVHALYSNTTGGNNSANGFYALQANTSGGSNVANGTEALYSNTSGNLNTAVGNRALYSNTEAMFNTAIGNEALYSNTTGTYNTATGVYALRSNTTGADNSAMGDSALSNNTSGEYNTAAGANALISNTTGRYNTAIGSYAGIFQTTGSNNIYVGASVVGVAGESNITRIGSGQTQAYIAGIVNAPGLVSGGTVTASAIVTSGTITAAVFSGNGSLLTGITTTQTGAVSKAGDTMTGNLNLPSNGLVVGTNQLAASAGNIGIGTNTPVDKLEIAGGGNLRFSASAAAAEDAGDIIFSNNAGVQKGRIWALPTAGAGLYFSSGDNNADLSIDAAGNVGITGNLVLSATTASGGMIMQGGNRLIHTYSTTNFFAGPNAGNLTMTGGYNTGIGPSALIANTTGISNTAVGVDALVSSTTALQNTAIGRNALRAATTGYSNTASGAWALYSTIDGNWNTASGLNALYANTSGSGNTAVGVGAMNVNTTGTNNTALGYASGVSTAALSNATALGYNAMVNASNKVRIGNASVTVIEGQVAWSFPSDARIKKDIQDIGYGLKFIKQLRPVQYRLMEGNDRIDFGFIAQDVELTLGSEYNILGIGGDTDRMLSLRYTDFIAPMVKAMQEQQGIIEKQQAVIDSLTTRLEKVEALLSGK